MNQRSAQGYFQQWGESEGRRNREGVRDERVAPEKIEGRNDGQYERESR